MALVVVIPDNLESLMKCYNYIQFLFKKAGKFVIQSKEFVKNY